MHTRKTFLKSLGLAALASNFASYDSAAKSVAKPELKIGLASYTLREYSLDDTIKYCNKLNIKYLALKSFHLPLNATDEAIAAAAKKVRDAGIVLYGAGVIYMKTEAEVANAFRYAKAAGLDMIIGVPNHELLAYTEGKVKETGIKLAIHNHGPGDLVYPTPDTVYEHIKDLDNRIGLCIDIGHEVRLNRDPNVALKKYKNRLMDMHIKDVDKKEATGASLEMGRGVIDLVTVFKTLRKINYQGIMGIEYEKDAKNAIIGLSECVGYVNGLLKVV